jgi:hypothetical protein
MSLATVIPCNLDLGNLCLLSTAFVLLNDRSVKRRSAGADALIPAEGHGIPLTEKHSLESRGDAYRQYQRSTSRFVPWFPKTP